MNKRNWEKDSTYSIHSCWKPERAIKVKGNKKMSNFDYTKKSQNIINFIAITRTTCELVNKRLSASISIKEMKWKEIRKYCVIISGQFRQQLSIQLPL